MWEKPVSNYVDLSFLDSVDQTVNQITTSEPFEATIHFVNDTIDWIFRKVFPNETTASDTAVDVEKPELTTPQHGQISIYNIEIGTPEETVLEKLGEPLQVSSNEYGTKWSTYHQDYHNFMMISYDERRNVNAIYTNDDLLSTESGVQYKSEKAFVREQYGEPLTEIRKGLNVFILQDSEEFDLFEVGDLYLYVFYDIHKNDTVTAVQVVSKELERQKNSLYATRNELLKQGFERQLFDLTNAARVRHGLLAVEWDEPAARTARRHSKDMADFNYFSHENLQGQSPFDRMKEDKISFRAAGENLAYGQSSSIFAHEGLMNSKGHRENILLDSYSHLGVGVAFNEENQPYYTENFLLK